jgi:hypothetical protein
MSDRWYTITVVEHEEHPKLRPDGQPKEIIACTVLPHLAGDILRSVAEEIAPAKPKSVLR